MLQNLTIENFIRLSHFQIKPSNPVILIAGKNESGKSSIAEAMRFAFRGENPRLKLKSERSKLLTNGATKGSVEVGWNNNTIKRNVRDGKVTGDTQYLPDDELLTDICFQAQRYATLDDKVRRTFMLKITDVDLSVDAVAEKLADKGIGDSTIRKYRPLLIAGLQQAHAHAKKAVSELRGAWSEVAGERYGSAKAEDWKPEQAVVGDREEVSASLAELEIDIAKAQTERDEKIAPITANISKWDRLLAEPEPVACPHCGGALLVAGDEVTAYDGEEVYKKRFETLRRGALLKRQSINDEFSETLNALQDNKRALDEQLSLIDSADVKQKRASELNLEIKDTDILAELLSDGPDGVASSIIAKALAPLNERLVELGQEIGWQHAVIHGDLSISRADGCIYTLLSESAQWRLDAMLHVLISELTEFSWLIFDRVDVLDIPSRGKFITWVAEYGQERADEPTILLMATMKQKPNLGKLEGIEAHWLDD